MSIEQGPSSPDVKELLSKTNQTITALVERGERLGLVKTRTEPGGEDWFEIKDDDGIRYVIAIFHEPLSGDQHTKMVLVDKGENTTDRYDLWEEEPIIAHFKGDATGIKREGGEITGWDNNNLVNEWRVPVTQEHLEGLSKLLAKIDEVTTAKEESQ